MEPQHTLEPTISQPLDVRKKTVVAVAIGNLLEWYDFAVYAALAAVLAKLFFPAENSLVSLLGVFSVFAVGYAARPIGAVLFGRLADTRGRRRALMVVVLLMGVATVGIGLLPTYESIGVIAPVMLVLARLAQGLSAGGEFSAATSFLVEIAPTGRRGLFGAIAYTTANLGFALGLGLVLLLNVVLPAGAVEAWAWRIPFLIGLPLLFVGVYLRSRAEESPGFDRLREHGTVSASPLRAVFTQQWRQMLKIVTITAALAVASYTLLVFVFSYLTVLRDEPATTTYVSVLLAAVIAAGAYLAFGALSDRVGRRPILLGGYVLLVVVAVPAFQLLQAGGFVASFAGQLLLWLPVSMIAGVVPAVYSEMFPTRLRSSGVGIGYAAATAIFSGTTPLVATLLIDTSGNLTAPAFYLMLTAAVSGCVAAVFVRETAQADLRDT